MLVSSFLSANFEYWIAQNRNKKEIATDLYSRFWMFRWIAYHILYPQPGRFTVADVHRQISDAPFIFMKFSGNWLNIRLPPPPWGLEWFEMNVKRRHISNFYTNCVKLINLTSQKHWSLWGATCSRQGKIPSKQTNATPVLENRTLYKRLLCFVCTAFVRDFLFPGKNTVTTFWPLDFVLTIKNVQSDFILWHIEITTRGRICDLLLLWRFKCIEIEPLTLCTVWPYRDHFYNIILGCWAPKRDILAWVLNIHKSLILHT